MEIAIEEIGGGGMTEQEAIWVLKDFDKQVTAKSDGAYQSTIGKMACDRAISALEEIQQYRALGTVEKLKAKLALLNTCQRADSNGRMVLLLDKNGYCKELDSTVEELREAREKQMPKKPTVNQYFYFCSNCGTRRSIKQKHCFCHDCGQAIDWSD